MSSIDRPPGKVLLTFGAILPLFVLLVELTTGLCADSFFDPLPTWGHVLIVLAVPVTNVFLWRAAQRREPHSPWLMVAAGAAMAIAAAYALLFVPMMPIALIAVVIGLGLLPLAPALALIATARLAPRVSNPDGRSARRCLAGAAIGLAALLLVDLPATATYLALRWSSGDEESVRRGTALMRNLGDEQMLLRLCYGEGGRAAGLTSFFISSWNEGVFSRGMVDTGGAARELYYRATGLPFNAGPRPGRVSAGRGREWDDDRGGTAVGGRATGLALTDSRIDGSIASAENVAYIEWTASFANRSDRAQEARLTLALPPGAVASRATLWVDGEPREASVAGRGETRAAYQSIVSASRDPLLVTTDGAGRVLVQAFPVQPGTPLKLRIGLSAPLEIARDGRRSLALPAIAERNFDVASEVRHEIWIESDAALTSREPALAPRRLPSGVAQLRGAVSDELLAARRPRIWTARAEPSVRTASLPARDKQPQLSVVQTVARASAVPLKGLTILLDSSAGNRPAGQALAKALDEIPAGLPVGLVVAAEEPRFVAAAPWSAAQHSRIAAAVAATSFTGGQDNLAALARALDLAGGAESALLWIHGPQPVSFARSRARIEQQLERRTDLPRLIRYQAMAGPAFALPGSPWFETARMVAPSGDAGADLTDLLAETASGGETWQVTRVAGPASAGPNASQHILRLWGAQQLAGAAEARGKARQQAIDLAHRLNIVTPVSGAVVLETDKDYGPNGLPVPGAADVPTVPEPAQWALFAIVLGLLLWLYRRRLRPSLA
jgi:hypothetical protein